MASLPCHLPYSVLLDDGSRRTGVTDSNGCTERIVTYRPSSILSLTLTPPLIAQEAACCATEHGDGRSTDRIYINNQSNSVATTNNNNVGTSKVTVSLPEGTERGLTAEEIAMARTVFGNGIDYTQVRVHHGGWWLFMGKQDPTTAVTPNGEMYFPSAIYRDDFAGADDRGRALFMHELAHVWQYQMGYGIKRNALTVTSRGASAYGYSLTPTSRLSDFNMEQQGNIMSDYYMICILRRPQHAYNPQMSSELLYNVMTPFVNPRDKSHLPK
ncbi:DUF4157 domain-containing protein [Cupriavidus sp. 2TAF22]|uniref:eCIS core domain-containing protein n=1 Tax=unclassified Cupriavidus TaxID=2640874 RepID=UPI003F92075F